MSEAMLSGIYVDLLQASLEEEGGDLQWRKAIISAKGQTAWLH